MSMMGSEERNHSFAGRDSILRDLTRRARGGIFIYPLVWFVTAFWGEIMIKTPRFFYLHSSIFAGLMILRLSFDFLVTKKIIAGGQRTINFLVMLILMSCLHWGLLSGWIIYIGDYPKLHYPYIIILAAFVTGGTTTLSIATLLRILYPLLMFGPSIFLALFTGAEEDHILAVLALFTIVYILDASRVSSRDYWRAVHQQRLAEKRALKLRELSVTDYLTQLGNRSLFDRELRLEWKKCCRFGVPLSLLLMDLDHFKAINDTYGHGYGDRCLELVGKTLKKELSRETDIIARYGGEEFAIVLPGTNLIGAQVVAERIVNKISLLELFQQGNPIPIRCSVGVATITENFDKFSRQDLVESADKELYRAKAEGRNRWCARQLGVKK